MRTWRTGGRVRPVRRQKTSSSGGDSGCANAAFSSTSQFDHVGAPKTDASTLVESAEGTNAIATGLPVEPFWSPVGAGPACGFGSGK